MFERGDIVIFRPKLFPNKYDHLTVGIVQYVQYHFLLIGRESVERKVEVLSIRIVGAYQATTNYPDKLDKSTICGNQCYSGSCRWYQLRREVLVGQLDEFKLQRDCHVDIARTHSSSITDLDILFASQHLLTDKSSISGLYIGEIQVDDHVHHPSIFHSKIETAERALRQNQELRTLFHVFNAWQEFAPGQIQLKVDAAIMIQKYIRRFCERYSLEKQRTWKKWWYVHRDYWFDYVKYKDDVLCYKVRGNNNYFSTKVIADKWKVQMKKAIDVIELHAGNSVFRRLNEALRRWKLEIMLQKDEIECMSLEDFLSSFLSHTN